MSARSASRAAVRASLCLAPSIAESAASATGTPTTTTTNSMARPCARFVMVGSAAACGAGGQRCELPAEKAIQVLARAGARPDGFGERQGSVGGPGARNYRPWTDSKKGTKSGSNVSRSSGQKSAQKRGLSKAPDRIP